MFRKLMAEKEILIRSLDKLGWVDKFCYLGDIIGAGGGPKKQQKQEYKALGEVQNIFEK